MTRKEAKNLILQLAKDFDIAIAMDDEESAVEEPKEKKWYTGTKFDIKDGDTYFAIDTDGSIDEIEYGDFPGLDVNGANFGNLCKDIEYLKRRLPEVTLYNRLSNFAEVVNEGWKPDWRNRDELKYSVACNNIPKIWEIAQHRKTSFPNTVYFKTEELAQRAIDEIVIPWEKEFRKMIKFEKEVLPSPGQMMAIIRGARNAMNSWDRMDSYIDGGKFVMGSNDMSLLKRLSKAGTDDAKYMRMVVVIMDITAPLYWWSEYDTYKVGTVANSCSKMHKIHAKELTLDDFSTEHLSEAALEISLIPTINVINKYRDAFNMSRDKGAWWQMIQLLPSSYNQKRTVLVNYQVLKNMYHARKNHKLDEWREFCKWIEWLPFAKELIVCDEVD